jgi:hypothetical protein
MNGDACTVPCSLVFFRIHYVKLQVPGLWFCERNLQDLPNYACEICYVDAGPADSRCY